MCLNPIKIGNPSRRFTDGLSRTILTVPCGHCKECLKANEDDAFVRSFFEYKRCIAKGGAVYFVLLTYDQEHTPWYVDDETGFTCPCFEPEHLRNFKASMRTYLRRDAKKGIIEYEPTPENVIHMQIMPEYGGKNGHPHFHALIYVPFALPLSYVLGTWSVVDGKKRLTGGLIQRSWPYGFVSWSKDKSTGRLRPFLESEKGVQYATKYVNKEQKWLSKYGIPEFMAYLKEQVKSASGRNADEAFEHLSHYQEKLREFKHVMPRAFTSTNFGVDGLQYYKNDDGTWNIDALVDGRIDLTKCGKTPDPKHPSWLYNMPRYYSRKIMYNCVDGLWSRNELGFEVEAARFWISKKRQEEAYAPYMSLCKMSEHLSFVKRYHADECNLVEDYEKIKSLMAGRTVQDLVMYDKVFRGIPLAYDTLDCKPRPYEEREHLEGLNFELIPENINMNRWLCECIDLTPKEMMKYFHDHELGFYMETLNLDREPDAKGCARCHRAGFYKKRNGFEVFDCFRGFDDVLEIIEKYERLVGECVQDGYDVTEKRKQDILALTGQGGWIEFDI